LQSLIVRKLTYRDLTTATRPELMGALEPTATLKPGDVLDQLVRLDGEEREKRGEQREERMAAATDQTKQMTRWIAILTGVIVVLTVVNVVLVWLTYLATSAPAPR
jgi:hypothetical protein